MKRLIARLGLVAVAIGAPAVLNATAGRPALPSLGSFDLDTTYMPLEPLLDVLAMVAWVVWAYLVVAVLLRVLAVAVAQRTGRTTLVRATDRFAPRPLRRWVDLAVGGVFLASTFSVGRAVALPTPAPAIAAVVAPAQPAPAKAQPAKELKRYVVRPGDSLWAIAERELGSGFGWKEIYKENRGRRFPDGRCLENPRLIHPGWDLRLPVNGAIDDHRTHRHGTSGKPTPEPSPAAEAAVDLPSQAPEIESTPTARPTLAPSPDAEPTPEPAEPPPAADTPPPAPEPVVTLPSGAVVAASFACGVLSAELLTRLRRRRARSLLSETGEVEMPERLVRDMRHAGAAPTATPLDVAVDEVIAAWRAHTGAPPRLIAAIEERRRIEILLDETPVNSLPKPAGGRLAPEVRFERAGSYVRGLVRGPFPQRLRRISTPMQRGLLVPLGHAAKAAVHVAPLSVGAMSISGEESEEIVHQLILAQATEAGPDDLQVTLIGGAARLRTLPQVSASADWDDATEVLQEIQAEFIRRARLLQREGVEDIGEHLAQHSDEQLAALVILAVDPPSSMRGVLDAIAQEVSRYGGALLAVGWTPATTNVTIIAEGGTLQIQAPFPLPSRLAPFTLDEQTARDVLEVIRQTSIQQKQETEDAEAASDDVDAPVPSAPVAPREQLSEPPTEQAKLELPTRAQTPEIVPPHDAPAVRCLGSFVITRDGNERIKGWRTKSRELVAYLIAHPDGATRDRLMDQLWPGEDPEQIQALFDKAVSAARVQVRGTTDNRAFLVKADEVWRLEDGSWWIDAHEFDRLIEEAERSGDQAESCIRFRQAISLYKGNFCAELAYPWAEPVRERYRSRFTRASARLAENLAEADQLDEALDVLDKATEIDPLYEDLWRLAMTIESTTGRKAAAIERYERLRGILARELNVEPDPETQRIALAITPRLAQAAVGGPAHR